MYLFISMCLNRTNCRNKAAESQSFWFWTLWLVGDICNFSGCILTKNLITNIALAFVYLTFTAFACLQFIWYEFLLKKYNFKKQKRLHLIISNADIDIDNIPKHKESEHINDDSAMYKTPSFAQKYHLTPKMTPSLQTTLKILSRSPRMYSLSTQLTPRMRREYELLQAQCRKKEQHYFDYDEDETKTEPNATQKIKIYNEYNENIIDCQSAPLRPLNNPHYGSMSTIMSTMSSMTMTCVMLYSLNQNETDYLTTERRRVLLSENESGSGNELLMIGMILGWFSSFIYISSRIPQLRLMLKTLNVDGINPAFFCLTFSGNLTQCLSMLINKQIYQNSADFVSKLPWICSAGICIFQDGLILFLIYLFRGKKKQKMHSEKKSVEYSKGVMMPSPHYLIQQQ